MLRAAVAGALALAAGAALPGCGSKPEPPDGPHTVELHAHGIKNEADRTKLEEALKKHAGVTRVKVALDGDVVIGVANGRTTRAEALEKTCSAAGFPAHEGGH